MSCRALVFSCCMVFGLTASAYGAPTPAEKSKEPVKVVLLEDLPVQWWLLSIKDIRKELGLSVADARKLSKALGEKYQKLDDDHSQLIENQINAAANAGNPLPDQAIQKLEQGYAQTRMQLMTKELKETLKKEQFERLSQIDLQTRGYRGLLIPQVIQKLGLSEESCKKIDEVTKKFDEELNKLITEHDTDLTTNFGVFEEDRIEEFQEKADKLRQTAFEAAAKILTDKQRQTWESLLGKKYTQQWLNVGSFNMMRMNNFPGMALPPEPDLVAPQPE